MTSVIIFLYMQFFPTFQKNEPSETYYRRDFKNYDNEMLANNVESSLSTFFFNSDCITSANWDKSFETFIAIIKTEIDKLTPVAKLSRKCKLALKPWISKGVWISIKKIQKLYKNAYPNGSPLDILFTMTYFRATFQMTYFKATWQWRTSKRPFKSHPIRWYFWIHFFC